MALDDLYAMPGHLFRRMQQIAAAAFMEECAGLDLTPVQFAAMTAIQERPGIDVTRLSALIAFDKSTLGDVIERLEGKRLIARRPSAEDKRVKLLHLTAAGRDLVAAAAPLVARAQERMLAPLARAERKALITLMRRLVDVDGAARTAPRAVGAR